MRIPRLAVMSRMSWTHSGVQDIITEDAYTEAEFLRILLPVKRFKCFQPRRWFLAGKSILFLCCLIK